MSSLNLKNWRDLAQNTEYVPPHLSLVEVQCNTPKTVPFTNLSHLREAQAIQVQLKSRKRSSENKNSHEIYMPDYPKSNRSSKTLDALVQEIEKSQKNDIRTRLSGHLNEKHVYEAMHSIPCSIPFSNEPLLKKVNSLVDVHQIDEPLPKNLSQSEVSELIEKVPEQSATSPRMRHSTCPLFSEKKENVTCSANNHTKNKDKIFRLHHQMKNELLQDRHPLAQLAVAGQYFENIIQDFRVYSPLFSEIKAVYDSVAHFYKAEVMELEVLKRRLITEIVAYQKKVKAENLVKRRAEDLENENSNLKYQISNLQVMLEHYQRASRPNSVDIKSASASSKVLRLQKEMSEEEFFSNDSQE